MTIAYVEMIGGASGNMLLGALIDAGADAGDLERALRTIPVRKPWTMKTERVTKRGIAATYLSIEAPGEDGAPDHSHDHRSPGAKLGDVIATVEASGLTDSQKSRARAIYSRLAESEARVHGSSVDEIHFHEVGATDAILDVAGTCFALDALGVARVHCSAFPIGHGAVSMEHGLYPNPPPATADLLRGFTTFDGGQRGEMVTTTGAAILTTLAGAGTARPAMTAERIGYGAGTSEFVIPNVLRVSIGPSAEDAAGDRDGQPDVVAVLQANIDDMSPQFFELAIERTFAAGALDVWLVPISMKKSRPAVLFCAIAPLERERECAEAILRETTTLGVRIHRETRRTAERRVERIATPLGTVRIKTAIVGGVARRSAEYDDLLRIAREQGRPIAEVALEVEKILGQP